MIITMKNAQSEAGEGSVEVLPHTPWFRKQWAPRGRGGRPELAGREGGRWGQCVQVGRELGRWPGRL